MKRGQASSRRNRRSRNTDLSNAQQRERTPPPSPGGCGAPSHSRTGDRPPRHSHGFRLRERRGVCHSAAHPLTRRYALRPTSIRRGRRRAPAPALTARRTRLQCRRPRDERRALRSPCLTHTYLGFGSAPCQPVHQGTSLYTYFCD